MKHYIISERALLSLYRAEEELNALEAGIKNGGVVPYEN